MRNKHLKSCFILVIGIIFSSNSIHLQSINELKTEVTQAKVLDSSMVIKSYMIAQYYFATDIDSSLKFANLGFQAALQLNNRKLMADGFMTYAGIAFRKNQPVESRKLLLKSGKLYSQVNNPNGIGLTLNMAASSYSIEGKYIETIQYRFYAIRCLEKGNDVLGLSVAYSNLSADYRNLNNLKKSLEAMKFSVELKETINNPLSLTYGYINLGAAYQNIYDFKNSLLYYQKALELAKKHHMDNLLFTIHLGLCNANIELNHPEKALSYLKYNIDNYGLLNNNLTYMHTHLSRAKIHLAQNKIQLAIKDYEKALEFAEKEQDPYYIRLCHDQLYQFYTDTVQQNFEKALLHFKYVVEMDKENEVSEANLLAEDLKIKYETEKKEQNIALLESENKLLEINAEKRKLWFVAALFGGLFLFLLLVFIVILFVVRNRDQKKMREIQFIKTKAEFEHKVLRAQMNPHFIFNSLNSIQHYILNNDTTYAYDYLAKFSKLIRLVLANSELSNITLRKEIELLELYIDLEKRRFENRFTYNIMVDKGLDLDEITIPVMLIQPFVENSIWHGIMNLEENKEGEISIHFAIEHDLLTITIEDNGIGRVAAEKMKTNQEHESVGMLFSKKRLEMMNMVSGKDADIIIVDLYNANGEATGTRVLIKLHV